jgi:hypothetical protein
VKMIAIFIRPGQQDALVGHFCVEAGVQCWGVSWSIKKESFLAVSGEQCGTLVVMMRTSTRWSEWVRVS